MYDDLKKIIYLEHVLLDLDAIHARIKYLASDVLGPLLCWCRHHAWGTCFDTRVGLIATCVLGPLATQQQKQSLMMTTTSSANGEGQVAAKLRRSPQLTRTFPYCAVILPCSEPSSMLDKWRHPRGRKRGCRRVVTYLPYCNPGSLHAAL